jgi:hypothetical protein
MRSKSKTVFWGFFSLDYKAMETYLEDMARKGWMLEKVGRITAKFKAIEPRNLKFYVDVFKEGGPLTPENTREAQEYRNLCQDSGWNYITSQDYLQFFYAEADSDPVPIQTDQALEQKIVQSTLWKHELLSIIATLLVIVFLMAKFYPLKYTSLLYFTGVTVTFLLPLLGLPVLFIAVHYLIWMLRARNNIKKGLAIEKPTLKAARKRSRVYFIPIYFYGFIFLLAVIADAFFLPDIILVSLLPLVVGTGIGMGIRYMIKKKAVEKSDAVTYVIVAIVILLFIGPVTGSLLTKIETSRTNRIDIIPEGYPVVTLYDLTEGAEQGKLISREFSPGMSPLTPKHYSYWETIDINGETEGIRVNYYKTLNPHFARIIFDGVTKKLEKGIKWRGMHLLTKTIITDDAMKKLWDVDNLALTEERDQIIVRKGNIVVHLEGDIDFEKREIREIIISKLLK